MGRPIAQNLVKAGYRVLGHDTNRAALESAAAFGVEVATDLDALASRAPIWLVVVPGESEVREATSALIRLMPRNGCVVICSTIDIDVTLDVGAMASRTGVAVCDAALARGVPAARDGTLLIYCGGSDDAIARVRPILDVIARDVVHVGVLGSGEIAKMLNNLLLWSNIAAVTEAMRLAIALGRDPTKMAEALSIGSGQSWVLDTWERSRPMPDAEDDLGRVLRTGSSLRVELPLARVVERLIKDVKHEKAAWLHGGGVEESMAEFLRSRMPAASSPTQGDEPS